MDAPVQTVSRPKNKYRKWYLLMGAVLMAGLVGLAYLCCPPSKSQPVMLHLGMSQAEAEVLLIRIGAKKVICDFFFPYGIEDDHLNKVSIFVDGHTRVYTTLKNIDQSWVILQDHTMLGLLFLESKLRTIERGPIGKGGDKDAWHQAVLLQELDLRPHFWSFW